MTDERLIKAFVAFFRRPNDQAAWAWVALLKLIRWPDEGAGAPATGKHHQQREDEASAPS